jgi:hypothetical protein
MSRGIVEPFQGEITVSSLERGQIQFFEACLPSLFPGDYVARVDQTVKEIRPDRPFQSKLEFSVAGPRFSLNPRDVYSVYPPANQAGNFTNSLPHVVFTRRTLPWERTMEGKDPDPENPCPWLALLLLGPSDFEPERRVPEINTHKVGELLHPAKEDRAKGPDLDESDLNEYESTDDLCNTIDIPAPVFSSLVPARADLPYLAHVRQVDTGNKETLSLLSDGCFSVVLGNRFPETTKETEGVVNTACLVSLEGFQNYLDGAQTIREEKVRLAVLAHWAFICQGEEDVFKVLMHDLSVDLLQLPFGCGSQKDRKTGPDGASEIKEAFAMGYTAMNHHVRNGEKTVSWYRGPLVPVYYPKLETYPYLPCADAALRYNYETGLLDATYAAAWQLGRLLALQDRHFARSLHRYREQARQKTKGAMKRSELQKDYSLGEDRWDLDDHLMKLIQSPEGKASLETLRRHPGT